jgi:hypothetical protein
MKALTPLSVEYHTLSAKNFIGVLGAGHPE